MVTDAVSARRVLLDVRARLICVSECYENSCTAPFRQGVGIRDATRIVQMAASGACGVDGGVRSLAAPAGRVYLPFPGQSKSAVSDPSAPGTA